MMAALSIEGNVFQTYWFIFQKLVRICVRFEASN